MARRRSVDKPVKRQNSQGYTGDDARTPKRKRVAGDRPTCTPLQPIQNINVIANGSSSVSFPCLNDNKLNGNLSITHTAPAVKKRKQMNCDKRCTEPMPITESCAQTRCKPETRKRLIPQFNASVTNKENCLTVEGAKATYEHRKVTVTGQIVADHSGDGQKDHQYRLRDSTGTITLFTKDKKLEPGVCYSVTDVFVQSQKTLVASASTTCTPVSPLKGIESSSRREISGQIVSAKVSLEHICINCSAPLLALLNQKDVKCHKCSHTVVYKKMPQTVTADITLKTTATSESALPFSLSHSHLQELAPFCDTGYLDTADIEQQLLEMKVCLTVEGKEVINICGSA